VRAEAGDWLDPLEFERVRYRLGSLGVFDTVELRYEPPSGGTRDAVFLLDEARRWEASLLAGYGSYEQLRGGIEWRQLNHFGRAHSSRLQLVQSMKSSRGEYAYTVPELFGELVDGTARVFGFEREEQSFVRQEYGGSVTLRRPAPFIRADAFVGYTFQALRTKDNELETREIDEEEVTVASVDVGLNRDTRDNPLRPRQGYRWYAQVEAASEVLGGEVDYQRSELGLAIHRRVGRGRWVHAGLTHGVLTTFGTASDRDLPVNKRFFPGGDGSIRGYQAGEASPRAADGRFLGAKTFTLVNLEFEQTITGNWSAVVFVDALGSAVRLADYPWNEHLVSAGLGIRYQTLIGPLRLEYGRNLNPRPDDPDGTLHFSVGFPF
jgi:outer membrane protein assembly factor BamA